MAKSNYIIRAGADFSSISKEMKKTQTAMSNFQSNISKSMSVVGKILGSIAVGKLIKDSTQMAMSVESAIDNISRNMGKSSQAFNSWVEAQSKGFGMAKADAYKYGSTFSNLVGVFSKSTEETSKHTSDLMKAAAIISSKTGRSYEDTANRIRSGMLGSTEAIEDLGVYTNVSIMESTEAFKKFANGKSWAQLDFQTQQQIRLASILEQTYKRYGDTLADTTTTRQNQFVASLKNAQLSLGQAFLPIYNAVLPALTRMAEALGAVIGKIAQFSQAIFGKANVGTTQSTEEKTEAIEELGDATENVGKQAKKAKGALAGFDELNLLGNNESIDDIKTPTTDNATWQNEQGLIEETKDNLIDLYKYLEPLKNISFNNISDSFNRLKQSVEPLTQNIFSGLDWAYFNIFIPFSTFTIQDFIPAFMDLLSASMGFLNATIEILKPSAMWLWDTFLQPIAEWTGGVIIEAIKKLTNVLRDFSDWTKNNKEAVELMSSIILGFFAGLWIYNTSKNIAKFLTSTLIPAFMDFRGTLSKILSPTNLAAFAIGALAAGIIYLAMNWDKLTPAQRTITILGGLAAALTAAAVAVAVFHTTWTVGLGAAAIVGGLALLAGTYLFTMSNAKLPSISGGGGGSLSGGESMMKTISKGSPLPQLASGGIITSPTVAMMGEYPGAGTNPEIVTPESLMRQIVREESGGFALGDGNITIEMPVYLDSSIVFKGVKKIAWEEFVRSGESPFPA